MGWTIRRGGTNYEVVEGNSRREALLLADDAELGRVTAEFWGKERLRTGELSFEVQWGPRNTLTGVHLIEDAGRVPLAPPTGSRAERREALARDHPLRFVLRRVAVAGVEIVIGVLGISAMVAVFFGQLMPRIDLSWIPRPDLPDIDPPDWLRYVDPFWWIGRLLRRLPDLSAPGWVDTLLDNRKFWLPVLIAALVALGELEKRRRRDSQRADDPGTDVDPSPDADR